MIEEHRGVYYMSIKTFACIMLKVPHSGTDWLDELIQKSRDLDIEAGYKINTPVKTY